MIFALPPSQRRRLRLRVGVVLMVLALAGSPAGAATTLNAANYGAVGDGRNDDGPAILNLLNAAATASPLVTLQFATDKTYYLKTTTNRYAFYFNGAGDYILDGGGSTFLVDAKSRFLSMNHCTNMTVRNCNIDFSPLPIADGVVVAANAAAGTFDVQIDGDQALPPDGGATGQDGEQAWFGFIWFPGAYSDAGEGGSYLARSNVSITNCRRVSGRTVRVQTAPNDWFYHRMELDRTRFSAPVPGVAHCVGPGECVQIYNNTGVILQNINLWSAPWFAFGIFGNQGAVAFTNVNIRPKPGTSRTATAARDGFHVKCNRGPLLWDNCIVMGNGDDAFNIATHASTVRSIISPNEITISQNYPLGVAAMAVGDTLVFYGRSPGKLLGRAHITRVSPANFTGSTAPLFTIQLDATVGGWRTDDTLCWNEQSSNPHTTLRNCRLDTSSRLRSPVTLEHCQINALAWFTGDEIEGPVPSHVRVQNCQFRLGQGNPVTVVVLGGPVFSYGPSRPVIPGVTFERNTIYGDFVLNDALGVVLNGNNFVQRASNLIMNNDQNVHLKDNVRAGQPLNDVAAILGNRDASQFTFAP